MQKICFFPKKTFSYSLGESLAPVSWPQRWQRGSDLTIPLVGGGWEWAEGSMAKGLLQQVTNNQ